MIEKSTQLSIALTNDYYPDFAHVLYNKLVSERVKEIFKNENVTGCCLGQVNIVPKDNISQLGIQQLKDDGIKINKIPNNPSVYYKLIVKRSAELHQKINHGMVMIFLW